MSSNRASRTKYCRQGYGIKPIFSGDIVNSLAFLKNMVPKYKRCKIGSIVIEDVELYFSDLHSFYHELNQIFAKNLYGFESKSDTPVIIDCGAHVGLASLYFASRYPSAKIYAFEADPDIHTLFEANIQNANLNNVTSYAKAVWIHGKGVAFDQSGDDSGHIDQESNNLVPSMRLKNFVSDFEKIDMLKLDVEGAEFEILEDCLPVLDRVQKIIIEVHAFNDDQKPLSTIFGTLDNADFNYVISDHHTATWLTPCNNPPFDFLNNDKYILTVYAWKTDNSQNDLNRRKDYYGTGKPQVAQFCMQDFGGAGTAALRLHEGLIGGGANNTFYVQNIGKWREKTALLSQANPPVKNEKFVSPEWQAFQAKNKEALSKYPNRPQGLEMFSIPWAATKLEDIPGLEEADIINLHWISGTLSIPDNIDFLKNKKIVWTLHDMNPFTGGCHYAGECRGYEKYCGNCPQLGSNQENDISREIWKLKKLAYRELDIEIVALCRWMAECVKKSTLLSPFPVHIIPNGVPTGVYKPLNRAAIKKQLGVPENNFVILFGSESVQNKRKGFSYLLRALEELKNETAPQHITLAIFGRSNQISFLEHTGFHIMPFDYVQNENELAALYNLADVTIIPSLEDNLPNIVLESLSCGTPVVGFDTGGIPDMVEHQTNGYLATVGDEKGLAQGMRWIIEQKKNGSKIRMKCRETVLKNFNLPLQARRYQQLYKEIIER